MTPVVVVLALLIGTSLGLVGGGGSILTVPALVHAGGFAPRDAIVASLIVVGVAATAGALLHWRLGTLDVAVAAWFGGLGAVGAMAGARLGRLVPAAWLMAAFAVMAVAAGLALVLGLPMARAVGTSLAVIAVNCAAGLTMVAGDLDPGRLLATAVFAALALLGTLAGARTAARARPEVLRRGFGLLVLGVGVYTGAAALV